MRKHRHRYAPAAPRHRLSRSVHALGIALVVTVLAAIPAEAQTTAIWLNNYAEVVKSGSPPDREHRYRFATNHHSWSVVAVAPAPGQNRNIEVTWWSPPRPPGVPSDRVTTQSVERGSAVDFVAIGSGRLELTDRVYTTVHQSCLECAGLGGVAPESDNYIIELAQGGHELWPAPFGSGLTDQTVWMSPHDVVRVWDTPLQVGEILNVAARGAGDIELFLVKQGDRTDLFSSNFIARASNLPPDRLPAARSDVSGPGGMEAILNYRAPQAGWYGVIMIKKPDPFASFTAPYTISRWL